MFGKGESEKLINSSVENILNARPNLTKKVLQAYHLERDIEFEKIVYGIISDIVFTFSIQLTLPISTLTTFITSLISRHKKLESEDLDRVIPYLMVIFEISGESDLDEEALMNLYMLLKAMVMKKSSNDEIASSLDDYEYLKLLNEKFLMSCMRIFAARNMLELQDMKHVDFESGFMGVLRLIELYEQIDKEAKIYQAAEGDLISLKQSILSSIPKLSVESIELADFNAIKAFMEHFAYFLSRNQIKPELKRALIDHMNDLMKKYFDLLSENGFSDDEIKYRIKSIMDVYGRRNGLMYQRQATEPKLVTNETPSVQYVEVSTTPKNHYLLIDGELVEPNSSVISQMISSKLDSKKYDIKKLGKKVRKLIESRLLVDFSWNGFNSTYRLENGVYTSGGIIRDPARLNEEKGTRGSLIYPLVDNISIKIDFNFESQRVVFSFVDYRLEI